MAKSKDVKPEPQKAPSNIPVFFVIGIVLVGAAAWWYSTGYKGPKIGSPKVTVTPPPDGSGVPTGPTPTPTMTELFQGELSYTIGYSSDAKGPKTRQALFQPHAPKQGAEQTITVDVSHTAPVDSVEMTVLTDTKSVTVPMNMISGSKTDGKWQAKWKVNDTYNYKFIFQFTSKSGSLTDVASVGIRQ